MSECITGADRKVAAAAQLGSGQPVTSKSFASSRVWGARTIAGHHMRQCGQALGIGIESKQPTLSGPLHFKHTVQVKAWEELFDEAVTAWCFVCDKCPKALFRCAYTVLCSAKSRSVAKASAGQVLLKLAWTYVSSASLFEQPPLSDSLHLLTCQLAECRTAARCAAVARPSGTDSICAASRGSCIRHMARLKLALFWGPLRMHNTSRKCVSQFALLYQAAAYEMKVT